MEDMNVQAEETQAEATQEMTDEQGNDFLAELTGEAVEETPAEEVEEEQQKPKEEEEKPEPEPTPPEEPKKPHSDPQVAQVEAFIAQMAQNAGITADEFMQNALDAVDSQKIGARVQQLVDQGESDEMAQYIAKLEMDNSRHKAGEETRQNVQREEDRRRTQFTDSVKKLEEMEPAAKTWDEFPKGMKELLDKGMLPHEAYLTVQLEEKRQDGKELEQLRQEKKNREKSPGSVKGAKVGVEDEFLREFMKD